MAFQASLNYSSPLVNKVKRMVVIIPIFYRRVNRNFGRITQIIADEEL